MSLPKAEHTARGWRIDEIAPDFALEDVWALPTPGGPGDFPRLIELMGSFDPAKSSSAASRALFAIRWRIGALLGWDDDGGPTLRERLPADLRGTAPAAELDALPFTPLYRTADEWAAEIANRTVHGVLHLGWVADATQPGGYRGQLAVLVRRNGLLGAAYMAAIAPFRHLIVYPQMLREVGRRWSR